MILCWIKWLNLKKSNWINSSFFTGSGQEEIQIPQSGRMQRAVIIKDNGHKPIIRIRTGSVRKIMISCFNWWQRRVCRVGMKSFVNSDEMFFMNLRVLCLTFSRLMSLCAACSLTNSVISQTVGIKVNGVFVFCDTPGVNSCFHCVNSCMQPHTKYITAPHHSVFLSQSSSVSR